MAQMDWYLDGNVAAPSCEFCGMDGSKWSSFPTCDGVQPHRAATNERGQSEGKWIGMRFVEPRGKKEGVCGSCFLIVPRNQLVDGACNDCR
jgi:hypothetical protein